MDRKLPENYTSKMASMQDLPRIHQLEQKKSLHYNGVPGITLERLQSEYKIPGFDPAKSVCLIENRVGELVALTEVWDESDPPVHPYVWVSVDPEFENQGLEDYLLAWGEKRAKQALERVDPELRVAVRSDSNHAVESSGKAKIKAGFKYIRHSYRMRIEMEEAPPEPNWPKGISMRLYNPDRDARLVYELDEEVFQDHFGFVKEDPEKGFEKFIHHMTKDSSYDPALWFLAVAGDEVVGICLCRRYGFEEKDSGWVSSLGIKRSWRRKGIALALLHQAFGEFYERGQFKVGLGVDAESLTGATDLYNKAGMIVQRRFDLYEKEIRPGIEVSVTELEPSED
jgi:mycothiol synthase